MSAHIRLTILLNAEQHEELKRRAGLVPLSTWMRDQVLGKAKEPPPAESSRLVERSAPAAAKPKSKKADQEPSSIAESVAGRTGHVANCGCFECAQVERFYRTQRGG